MPLQNQLEPRNQLSISLAPNFSSPRCATLQQTLKINPEQEKINRSHLGKMKRALTQLPACPES